MENQISIYVLPSQPGAPPRAIIFEVPGEVPEEKLPDDVAVLVTVEGHLVTWSRDLGTWLDQVGNVVPQELAEAITAHAKELGVKW